MKDKLKSVEGRNFLHYFIIGLLVLFYVTAFFLLRDRLGSPQALLDSVQSLYAKYGYAIVFLAGLIEGTFLLGMYIPGTAIILLGALFAKNGSLALPLVIVSGVSGLVLGYCIDYILGKFGWYEVFSSFGLTKHVDHAKGKLERYEKRALLLGFCSPLFATFLSTAAGMLRLPFKRFFALVLLVQLFWTTVYAVTAYFFGMIVVEFFMRYMGLAVTTVIVLWWMKNYKKRKK